MNPSQLDAQALAVAIRDALQKGRIVEAIKLMRSAGRLALKESRETLNDYQKGNKAPEAFTRPAPGGPLPADVVHALQQGNKIEAIRRMREQTGLGLKEAKDAVDAYRMLHPQPGDLSPGEVRSSSGWWGLVFALVVAVLLGYSILRRFA